MAELVRIRNDELDVEKDVQRSTAKALAKSGWTIVADPAPMPEPQRRPKTAVLPEPVFAPPTTSSTSDESEDDNSEEE